MRKVILASKSWLRAQILEKSEIEYVIAESRVDERVLETELEGKGLEDITIAIARAKALAVEAGDQDVVIGADTVAYEKESGRVFHKAETPAEALSLCMQQSGATIVVVTGFAIVRDKEVQKDGLSTTEVTYSQFTEDTLASLLAKDHRTTERNAALGFFIDAPGFTLVERFEGSYTGAMGLPMEQIRPLLKNLS